MFFMNVICNGSNKLVFYLANKLIKTLTAQKRSFKKNCPFFLQVPKTCALYCRSNDKSGSLRNSSALLVTLGQYKNHTTAGAALNLRSIS